ncbi:MAG: hypothetical protein ABFD54_12860 [Armatimonadota bacterium]|nr:hypothetical protein [bacterium]
MMAKHKPQHGMLPEERRLLEALDILIAAALDATAQPSIDEHVDEEPADEEE